MSKTNNSIRHKTKQKDLPIFMQPGDSPKHPENLRLAMSYRNYHIRTGYMWVDTYDFKARQIALSKINIPQYFKEHGNLDNLNNRDLGEKARLDLEDLLKGISIVL